MLQEWVRQKGMLEATDTEHAPWHIVRSDDKRRARLNLIAHHVFVRSHDKKWAKRGKSRGVNAFRWCYKTFIALRPDPASSLLE
jgi:hypothetical protein